MADHVLGRAWRIALHAAFSLALLAAVLALVDTDALAQRLTALDPLWLGAALLVTVPQYMLSAARWRLTASRLGAHLTVKEALTEYYLAVLGNQVLPGGVLGDAVRALRHGRRMGAHGIAIRAVIYERAAGQCALLIVMLPGLLAWPFVYGGAALAAEMAGVAVAIAAGLALGTALLTSGPFAGTRAGRTLRRFVSEAGYALLAPEVRVRQMLYSFGVLATYLVCFYCAARGVGLVLSFGQVMTLVPAVLFSMSIPLTIAGWGIREATAAGIWGLAGLAATDGVAASVAYGAIVLLSALPGVAVAAMALRKYDVGDQR